LPKLLFTKPITIKQANEFIKMYHRHNRPTTNNCGRWAIAAIKDDEIFGVLIAGNPVSATYMDGYTIELTRICVKEDAPMGTCSFLISKSCMIWKIMGGRKMITYTLDSESGASLRGAGWEQMGVVKPHKRWENKELIDGIVRERLEIYGMNKKRWEKNLEN
jgi:hypothetical protein